MPRYRNNSAIQAPPLAAAKPGFRAQAERQVMTPAALRRQDEKRSKELAALLELHRNAKAHAPRRQRGLR